MSLTPKDSKELGLGLEICLAVCFCFKTSQLVLMHNLVWKLLLKPRFNYNP